MKMRLAMVAAAGITGSFWACKDAPLPLEEHGNTPAQDAAAFATGNHGKGKGTGKGSGGGGDGGAGGSAGHARAKVLREEPSAEGEVRLYSGAAADLDGDGDLEIVTAGFEFDSRRDQRCMRVWNEPGKRGAALVLGAQLVLGAPEVASMRVNDLAIGNGASRPSGTRASRRTAAR